MHKVRKIAQRQDYKSVIFSGCAIESGGVSICNLSDYNGGSSGNGGSRYQVWSDRYRYYGMFHNIDEAVDKFLELKQRR